MTNTDQSQPPRYPTIPELNKSDENPETHKKKNDNDGNNNINNNDNNNTDDSKIEAKNGENNDVPQNTSQKNENNDSNKDTQQSNLKVSPPNKLNPDQGAETFNQATKQSNQKTPHQVKKDEHEELESTKNTDLNHQKCTFYFDKQIKIIDRQELYNDCQFFYSMSHIFQHFVRIKGKSEYKKDEILSDKDTEIYLEKSLPLIQCEKHIYIFSDLVELKNFYKSQNLDIKSVEFLGRKINLDEPHNFEEEKVYFDYDLQVNAVKKITNEYVINDKTIKIQMPEGASKEEQLEIIKKKCYNNKKFVYPELRDSNKIIAKIHIRGETEIECSENILDNNITTKDFLQKLRIKYNNNDISLDCDKKAIKNKLIDIDFDENILKIKNLQLVHLKIQKEEHTISTTNTINQVIEKSNPEKSKDKYFLVDNKLIIDKNLPASNYKDAKRIIILDIVEHPIILNFKCDYLDIHSINVNSDNIGIMDITNIDELKLQIIKNTNINRDPNMLMINNDEQFLIKSSMIGEDNKITIPLNVTLKKCAFYIELGTDKRKYKYINEKINCLAEKYECDKIKLFNDNKVLKDDQSFLFLTPEKDYVIELYDEYFISKPETKNTEVSTVLLQRFKTFGNALSSLDGFESVPYKLYYGDIDITDKKIKTKIPTSKEKPLILKIEFIFLDKKTGKTHPEIFDDLNQNIKNYIADDILYTTTIDRVDAKIINKDNEEVKKVEDDDTFGSIEYQKGYKIQIVLLPPTLKFKFDTTDINNILINKKSEILTNYSNRFPDKATVKDAKETISKELAIENDISFANEKILKDNELMFDIPESSFITIKLLPPAYTFIFKRTEYNIRFKTNLTIIDVINSPDFKKHITLTSPYHSIELKLKDGKKKTNLTNDMKIFDFYQKGNIFCKELDPPYNFQFNEKKKEIRIPDDTSFKSVREYVQDQYSELKDIQPSRIFFYSSKNISAKEGAKYKINSKINEKCSKDRDLIIQLDDPKYKFALDKKEKTMRFKEEKTIGDVIQMIREEFETKSYDIELEHELPDDTVLFKEKLYENTILLKKVPLMFHFKLNNSDEVVHVRFSSRKSIDSSKTSFQEIYDNKYIELHDDLINFDLLEKPSKKDTKLPPIGRFVIKSEDNNLHEFDEPFLNIIKNNKEEIIQIELTPPFFSFKTRSQNKNIIPIQVQRGKKVLDIKKDISEIFKLGQYDFYLKLNDDKLTDEDTFDNYEQDETQVFTIYPQNPLYSFKLSINEDESAPKKFRLNPSTTFGEVKSLILPQISPKRIEISLGENVLKDRDTLDKHKNDLTYTINVRKIQIKIQLPEILESNKSSKILIEKTSKIEDFKRKLLNERSELKKREISLYLSNQELKDETKYEDLIFIKGSRIECKIVFNYICSKESSVKFDNFKGILDKEITVSQCRRKCLDQIRKDPKNKCRNINRIKLKLNDKTLEDKDGKLIDLLKKEDEFREILVVVEKDEKFTRIKDKDKRKDAISDKFNCESNVSEIRKALGNNFIIKTEVDNSTIYDDMPLFSIPGNIYTENVSDKDTKAIEIQFLDELNERKFEKPRKIDFTPDTSVFDLKKVINDIYLTGKMNVDDIDILISLIAPNAEYPEDYPLINKGNNYRILCDSQNLFTFEESTIFVAKKDITKGTEPMVKLIYMSKENKENETSIKYDNKTTVEDLIKGIEFPEVESTQPVVLYMGRILDPKSKLKDVLVGDERNFYARLIQKLIKNEDDED